MDHVNRANEGLIPSGATANASSVWVLERMLRFNIGAMCKNMQSCTSVSTLSHIYEQILYDLC